MHLNLRMLESDAVEERSLDLPALGSRGHLPDGIHDACFEEVIERFATNPARKALCHQLEDFLLRVIDSQNYAYAYLGGEFVTAMPSPRTVELILQTRESFGLHAFRAMEDLMELGLESIHQDYSVRLRFWFDGTPGGLTSFRDYFESLLPRNEDALADPAKSKSGLIRIEL